MRTRTFIGLIFLTALLMIAAIPAALETTTKGAVSLLKSSGAMKDDEKKTKHVDAQGNVVDEKPLEYDPRVELKGYQADGEDLRDTLPDQTRLDQPAHRLVSGNQRVSTNSGILREDKFIPAMGLRTGVVLDANNCPVLPRDVNARLLWANEEKRAVYERAIGSANDSAECLRTFNENLRRATTSVNEMLPADQRRRDILNRATFETVLIAREFDRIFRDVFADADASYDLELDRLAESRGETGP